MTDAELIARAIRAYTKRFPYGTAPSAAHSEVKGTAVLLCNSNGGKLARYRRTKTGMFFER